MRILYCDVDTLRADHTTPYGYSRRTTPNVENLAKESVVLGSCYCSDSPCAPSRAALTSGQLGITTGAIGNFGPAAEIRMFDRTRHAPFFGEHLYRNGIYTASISCFPERHLAYWFVGNFRERIKPSMSNGDDEDAATVTETAIDWLRRHAREEDWLLHVHYWDPHIPYLEPRRWVEAAATSGPPPEWPDEETILAHQESYGPHSALDLYEGDGTWSVPPPPSPNPATMPDAIRSRTDFVRFVDGYDGAIRYWDHHLGLLFECLEEMRVLEDTAVIVASDHGECLGENGCYGDHPMANEASHRIPMIIRWPGATTGVAANRRRVDGLAYHIDLCPTVCEMLGIPVPEGWEGESFAAALRGEEFLGRESLVLSHGAYTYQRSLMTREHLYVRTLHPGCWRIEHEQLYAVKDDPHTAKDLIGKEPETARGMASLLDEWRHRNLSLKGPSADPMEAARYEGPADAFYLPAYLERLRGTGRSHLARDLEQRLSEEWVTTRSW